MKFIRFAFLVAISVFSLKAFSEATPISVNTNQSTVEVTTAMQDSVTAEGTIQKQGMTSYQYGTHVLKDSSKKTLYALTSKSLKLDSYVGKQVKVTGKLVDGYPVDGGPKFMEVTDVEEIK